jgi:hypothetical protein
MKTWETLCPALPNGGNYAECNTCCHANNHALEKMGCTNWGQYCKGKVKPTIQVFSDLPRIALFLNGASLGQADCTPSGFASFTNLVYAAGNLTAVGLTAAGEAVARHEIITAAGASKVELTIDVPSAATGTGNHLVLDGHDCALLRASIVDSAGRVVGTASNVVTFEVVSGPGRVAGVHNGDAKSHEPQLASTRSAYHGLARAAIKVTKDSTEHAQLLRQIDTHSGDGVTTVELAPGAAAESIVVRVSSPGLTPSTVTIAVSTDFAQHSVMATAAASVTAPFQLA